MPSDRSLPLSCWKPATAEIIPFPAARRIGKIRRIAQLVDESTTRAGKAHWSRTVDDLTRQMTRAGVPHDRIADELGAFTRAVIAELTRRSRGLSDFRPDGDAA